MSTGLEQRIRARQFVITAEIVPPLSAAPDLLLEEAALLRGKAHAINITDGAGGKTSISSFAASAILAANGYEPVLQVTCRDRNRIALAADLLGASAQGVHNVLMLRGDDPRNGDQPDAKPVFDLESADMMRLARDMRDRGILPSGRAIETPPSFFIGGADVPREPGAKFSTDALLAKAEAGVQFVQTQFCFDTGLAKRYLGRLSDEGITERIGFILGVGPIASARSARWMNKNLFGVNVPEAVIARLEGAADPSAEGITLCAELIHALRDIPGIAGVHLMAPVGGVDAIACVLSEAGLDTDLA